MTNAAYAELRNHLENNLAAREHPPTNPPPVIVTTNFANATNNSTPVPTNGVSTDTNGMDISTGFNGRPTGPAKTIIVEDSPNSGFVTSRLCGDIICL